MYTSEPGMATIALGVLRDTFNDAIDRLMQGSDIADLATDIVTGLHCLHWLHCLRFYIF